VGDLNTYVTHSLMIIIDGIGVHMWRWVFIIPLCLVALNSDYSPTILGTRKVQENDSIEKSQPLVQRQLCAADGPHPQTAFFVTLSGGGSRAALFGSRVLLELKNVGDSDLANKIDVISSVSGGSFAASLYGISKNSSIGDDSSIGDAWRPIWSDDLVRDRLSADIKLVMASKLTDPSFLMGYLFGAKTRTDALSSAIHYTVLKPYGDKKSITLADMNLDRPQIIINSTVATMDHDSGSFRPRPFGSIFTFSQSDLDSIGVDYSSIQISDAVSASAAFPGLLSPVVLNQFDTVKFDFEEQKNRYIHLMDAGAVDNMGLLSVKRALIENSYRLLRDCSQIIVLTVDSFGYQGEHLDDVAHEKSFFDFIFDYKTFLSSFDSLLSANRTRLLAEFKSRMFVPPVDSSQCRKDGLPYKDCVGGVRVNWDEINDLLKKKLFFYHISFDSNEFAGPSRVTVCNSESSCINPPFDVQRYFLEYRALKQRLKKIPTNFGLNEGEVSDITIFVKMLFTKQNGCLLHMRDMLINGANHDESFYLNASNSCDETASFDNYKINRVRSRQEILELKSGPVRRKLIDESFKQINDRNYFWKKVIDYYRPEHKA
jgi:predicted acylesterase/phospholipase RssA